ncbi:lysoplasmalogenase family protein [Algibacter mikhailovii]|nr:lysoplasmalogenase family protein [Algibacter mikhailovii]
MLSLFKDKKKFALLFFSMLIIDILVKLNCPVFPYRYISKTPILLLLVAYYYFNNTQTRQAKYRWTMTSLICFFIGDVLIISHQNIIFFSVSLLMFTLGKLFLSFRFSHKSDFQVKRLISFSIIMFAFTVGLISFIYEGLKGFFLPVIISYFISLLLFQFVYLRKDVVDKRSYLFVFFGVIVYMISEAVMVIKTFKTDLPFQELIIMLFYGAGLYLIVHGMIIEKKVQEPNLFEPVSDLKD